MTADEFNAWRDRLYLSQKSTAEALGISVRQVAYYANGEKTIPRTITLACEGLELRRALQHIKDAHELLEHVLETTGHSRTA